VWEWAKSLGLAVVLFLVIRTFLLQSFYISSGSMEPTLLVGDVLMVSKASYGAKVPGTGLRLPGWDEPSAGEIVIFRPEHDPETDVVKRIVGVPGDTLEMRDRVLYVNGERNRESYVKHQEPTGQNEVHPWMTWQYSALLPSVNTDRYTPSRDDWGPVVVPDDAYFVMGDNRERSLDSRFWGFLEEWRIRGKVSFLYYSFDPDATSPVPLVTAARWGRIGMTPGG
jgi:signal peptidase I